MAPDVAARRVVCHPTVWGNGKIDRRRGRTRHSFIAQPFYNQDFRVWCPRCGLLTTRPRDRSQETAPREAVPDAR